jgi:hypothetical protein
MSKLFTAVVSIAPTRRRRFLWAAWWTAPPTRAPFRKPDAAQGGSRTRAEALRQAVRAAGRPLVEIEAGWARGWGRILVGEPPWTAKEAAGGEAPRPRRAAPESASVWQLLGIEAGATVSEIKRAFRVRALATHPDHGGDPDSFRAVRRAYDEALRRRRRRPKS